MSTPSPSSTNSSRPGEPSTPGAPQALAARLAAAWPGISAADRAAVTATLARSGIVGRGGSDEPGGSGAAPPTPQLLALCELPKTASVDPAATLAAAEQLVDFAKTIERVAWQTWREVAPQSGLRSGGSIGGFIGQVLAADGELARREAADELGKVTKLIATIMYAVPQAARAAVAHLRHALPREIRDAVEAEGLGGPSARRDAACWKRYVELVGDFDQGAVENEVRRSVALHVDRLARE